MGYQSWDWDRVLELFAGSKLARDARAQQFKKDVRRAGIAQEQRARSHASSLRVSGMATNGSVSPERNTLDPVPDELPSLTFNHIPSSSSFEYAVPPGGMRPCVTFNTFRHPTYYESGDPVARPRRPTEGSPSLSKTPSFDPSTPQVNTTPPSRAGLKTPSFDSSVRKDSCLTSPLSPPRSVASSATLASQATGHQSMASESDGATDEPVWKGYGRFQHMSNADPEFIKARYEADTRGPGAYNFFGPGRKLGLHPLAAVLEGSDSDCSTQESLARKLRKEPSTTINKEGCVVTIGFDQSQESTPPLSRCTSNEDASERECRKPLKKPTRRITWDERTIAPMHRTRSSIALQRQHQQKRAISVEPRVKIVLAEEAESAIASDESNDEYEDIPEVSTPLEAVKQPMHSTPPMQPQKSILRNHGSQLHLKDVDASLAVMQAEMSNDNLVRVQQHHRRVVSGPTKKAKGRRGGR